MLLFPDQQTAARPEARRQLHLHRPEPNPRGTGWIAAVVLMAVAAAAVGVRQWQSPGIAPRRIATATVKPGVVHRSLRLTGSTAPSQAAFLRAPSLPGSRGSGPGDFGLTIAAMAPPGARVAKGDVVASFDTLNMRNRLDDFVAARIQSETTLRSLVAQLNVVRNAHEQKIRAARAAMEKSALDLQTAPVRSAMQVERFRLANEEARLAYDALVRERPLVDTSQNADARIRELDLEEARMEEKRVEANLDKLVIRAPIGGMLVRANVFRGGDFTDIEPGDTVGPGQFFLQIAGVEGVAVDADANQADLDELRLGARAVVRFEAFDGLELPAQISTIRPAARGGMRPTYLRVVPVRLTLERTDPRVIPGLSVSADVVVGEEQSAGVIPRQAVFYDGDGTPFAWVKSDSGWRRRDLDLGLASNTEVAVRAGLEAGDVVATEAPPFH